MNGKSNHPIHEELYFDGNEGYWAVREGDWKLLLSKKGELELYNLKTDKIEENNVASENQKVVNRLKAKYEKWRSEMGTPMKSEQ